MEIRVMKINQESVKVLESYDFPDLLKDKNSIYLFNVITADRNKAATFLESFQIPESILQSLPYPKERIRFEVFRETTYGEIAYFSSELDQAINFIGVVGLKNLVFFIHEPSKSLDHVYLKDLSVIIENKENLIRPNLLLYILVNQTLESQAKLILSYRENIEEFAKDFDHKHHEIEPEDFLPLKSQLSDFSRVLEKLHFTLNFPPVKKILDKESDYNTFFKDLLNTTLILKNNLDQTEQRLESLHNHYLLLLQEKSNKRINLLTIIQAIFVPLTLIAGIYGMNFQNMPELNITYGYHITLAIMAFITLGFIGYFFKQGWFE
ncbi:CorA family divalent cation transporter [Flexithrix dorotheae]|uniref:CorA family divalent cation transporter n=1 Tax=Flexithrix dorotheae TaxID=70993 RepID=UPI0003811902|nr:CorA family divalent cation transporter [Flexithrix dorotheae]